MYENRLKRFSVAMFIILILIIVMEMVRPLAEKIYLQHNQDKIINRFFDQNELEYLTIKDTDNNSINIGVDTKQIKFNKEDTFSIVDQTPTELILNNGVFLDKRIFINNYFQLSDLQVNCIETKSDWVPFYTVSPNDVSVLTLMVSFNHFEDYLNFLNQQIQQLFPQSIIELNNEFCYEIMSGDKPIFNEELSWLSITIGTLNYNLRFMNKALFA